MRNEEIIAKHFEWYYDNGYITARDGNAAFRNEKQLQGQLKPGSTYQVTASGVRKNTLTYQDFMMVDSEGKPIYPDILTSPSIETGAHVAALNASGKDVSVHVHSPNTVALAALFTDDKLGYLSTRSLVSTLNSKWPELFRHTKVGGIVPFLDPGSDELHKSIIDNIAGNDIVILQRHGVLAIGKYPVTCMDHIVRLEHVCGILLKIVTASNGRLDSIL